MDDLVSIIMPSFNTGYYIEETINSILDQSYKKWELLIVDDCSTDNTDDIIQPYLKDNRIRYFKNKTNSGAAFSRNFALRKAKGRWIAFLDSDDVWYSNKLSNQISFMVKNKINFSYCEYLIINEKSEFMGTYVFGPKVITKPMMYAYCWPGCLTIMYDRKNIGEIQINEIKKNNDYALWLEICEKDNCYLLNEILAKYRKRNGSISNISKLKLIKWHYKLWREVKKKNKLCSILMTIINLVCGVFKKIIFVRKVK